MGLDSFGIIVEVTCTCAGYFNMGMRWISYINRFAAVGRYRAGDDFYERRFTRSILAH